jgi:hypothetical protein
MENQEKWKTCKDDTMTTTANELGEREEKGKQDKEPFVVTSRYKLCSVLHNRRKKLSKMQTQATS